MNGFLLWGAAAGFDHAFFLGFEANKLSGGDLGNTTPPSTFSDRTEPLISLEEFCRNIKTQSVLRASSASTVTSQAQLCLQNRPTDVHLQVSPKARQGGSSQLSPWKPCSF